MKSAEEQKLFYTSQFMDLTNYRLERARLDEQSDREAWNRFVEASGQGTIFSRLDYLAGVNQRPGLWYCYKKQELKAAVAVMETDEGKSTDLHEFVIYGGIMLAPPHRNQNRAQVMSEQFRCTSFIVSALAERYGRICLGLSPAFVDIRPFLWHNYGQDDKPHFTTDVRFTSFVSLDGFANAPSNDQIPLYKLASTSRRQEIRYGIQEAVHTVEECQPDLFMDFYRRTIERQNMAVDPQFVRELRALVSHLDSVKLARMFVAYTAAGEPGSVAIFGLDSKRAYYLFGASDPDLRNDHAGTAVLWDAFRALNESGVQEIDLEGVNSPQRGYFKLSFGGSITPYFHLFLDNR